MTPAAEAVCVPAHSVLPGSSQAKQLCRLHAHLLQGQSCHRQKKSCVYAHRVTLVLSDPLQPSRLWPARRLCQGGRFPRQEHCSVLAATGCHVLLETILPAALAANPRVPGAARTPANQAAAPPTHLAPTEADPSPPGQPQEQTPVDNPRAEVEIKPQLKPRGSVTKEEDPKPSPQLYKLQIESTRSTRQTVSTEYIKGH
ncbi:unnamed protein product [Rangifer tarandus platyrhynchus]|uniref:Uncharacterized protein n=2 Tax=Rangifer tarandus platyrhynchus TaxID=3082113 RepID=A0AC60A6T6_RANTA|nr:unnamed protein product [Rangifer tarandus platyrhynchus]